MDGQIITLKCMFDITRKTVTWTAGGLSIYNFDHGSMAIPSTSYKSRIIDYQYTELEHQLALMVNKGKDEGQQFKCAVQVNLITDEDDDIQIKEILGKLDILTRIILQI